MPWLILLALQGAAAGTTVTGRVTDEKGKALAAAHAQCGERPNPVSRRVFADAQGRLSVRVPSAATHVYCAIGAPGHMTLRRTVPTARGRGDIGLVALQRTLTLAVGRPLTSYVARTDTTNIDLVVSNEAGASLEIRAVKLLATAEIVTSCYDPRPAIDFAIGDRISIVASGGRPVPRDVGVSLRDSERSWTDSVAATGFLQKLGCNQSRLEVEMQYILPLQPGDTIKIRFELPNRFKTLAASGGSTGPLNLKTWRGLKFVFRLADGTTVASQ